MRWLSEVRQAVDARLARYFEDKRVQARLLAHDAVELTEAVRGLTMRGGKRVRPAFLHAAFRAVAPERDPAETVDACAALELLQTYLLIHDDWMDQDEERRGGPSVHAALRDTHGGDAHLGASLAILAGNLASACAWELLTEGERSPSVERDAIRVFLKMHQEVVYGQQLDLLKTADVSRMQHLKTGSYTVVGPLLLGAALGEAGPEAREALMAFGVPLGEAFQMRDDLLGTFGDPEATGKPVSSDLREGKRTALVAAAERLGDEAQVATLRAVLDDPDPSEQAIEEARAVLVDSGAKRDVEARLGVLFDASAQALSTDALKEPGLDYLRALARRIRERKS